MTWVFQSAFSSVFEKTTYADRRRIPPQRGGTATRQERR
jgi:hypothetical protein